MSACCYPSGSLTEDELAKAPEGMEAIDMIGMPGMKFSMTVSAYDCTGCGSCANVCPGKKGEKLSLGQHGRDAGNRITSITEEKSR